MRPTLVIAILVFLSLLASPARAEWKRNHIEFSIGSARMLGNDFGNIGGGLDFRNTEHAVLAYRYSLNPTWDFSLSAHATARTRNSIKLSNGYFGPGARCNLRSGKTTIFLQGNAYLVGERLEFVGLTETNTGSGFGADAGCDFEVGRLVSIPLEVSYMYSKPSDNISALAVSVGVTFNFGKGEVE